MPACKPYLLSPDPVILAALQRWAARELRTVTGQIDYLLRDALRRSGRLPRDAQPEFDDVPGPPSGAEP